MPADVEEEGGEEEEGEADRVERGRAFLRGLAGLAPVKGSISPSQRPKAGAVVDGSDAAGDEAGAGRDLWEGLEVDERAEAGWSPAFASRLAVPWPDAPGPLAPRGVGAMKEHAKQFSIGEAGVAKVVPDRTFAIAFLPLADRAVVAVGDKNGRLGLWDIDVADANAEAEAEAGEAGEADEGRGVAKRPRKRGRVAADDGVFLYRFHVRPVCGLQPHPGDRGQLFSASYDGTVRRLDLQRLTSDPVLALREDRGDYFTDLAWAPDASRLAVGRGEGLCVLYDPREPPSAARSVTMHPRKINTLQWHPSQPLLLSSSNDGTATVWDTRKFQLGKRSSDGNAGLLCDVEHGRSVCGAAFSPAGDRIATVGMDDTVRVYGAPWERGGEAPALVASAKHHNNTGRWLTKFRPCFDPKHSDVFAVGAMRHPRAVDLFSATDGRLVRSLQDGEAHQSSVTSLHAFHPYLDMLAGCNSSGRVFVWRHASP